MNISGIRPSDGFYEKNTYKISADNFASIADAKSAKEVSSPVVKNDSDIAASLTLSQAGRKIAAKNIERAVSNMEQDTSLHRYQYFVQGKDASTENKGLENFSL